MADIKNAKQFVDEKNGLMIRVDKTLKEMMEEQPQSRWDAKYWHPKYDYISDLKPKMTLLKNLLVNKEVISADTVRASRGESYSNKKSEKTPYRYYSVEGILNTGYNQNHKEYGSKNAYERLRRSELKNYDIAIARSGAGSLGKSFIFIDMETPNIVSDLYIVRCDRKLINPFYVLVALKTKFGKDQIERNEKGVSGQTKITSDMIENFAIPSADSSFQRAMEKGVAKVTDLHNKAMLAQSKGDQATHNKNFVEAEEILKVLISKTQNLITEGTKVA